MKKHKVVMICLDACDAELAKKFAAQGLMPNLERLLKTSSRAPVANPYGLFVGSIWANFATALHPDRHGFFCWEKVDLETYEQRLTPPDIARFPQFWSGLSRAGHSVATIDVPHSRPDPDLNGIQITEWGCHDKHFGFDTCPPEIAEEIESKYGLHPVLKGFNSREILDIAPDDYVHRAGVLRTRKEECALLADMMVGIDKKRNLVLDVLAQNSWDFFVAVFGESHAIGHQQWHLHDSLHPRHDPVTVAQMGGDPILQVYAALDQAVGEIESAVDADLFMLHFSHGMGPHYDGTHLLDEVLARLDSQTVFPRAHQQRTLALTIKQQIRPLLPMFGSMARALAIPEALRRRVAGGLVTWSTPESRAGKRFFQAPNNSVYGGIRINLIGREPKGRVRPEDLDDLISQLKKDLLEVVNIDTGKRVVRSVERCDSWHRRTPTDDFPDLFIDWERTALIERVSSPKIGYVHIPYENHRTGDHRPAGLLLAQAQWLPAGECMPSLAVEDIGPSIAARFGIELPDVDGVVNEWLSECEVGIKVD